VDKPPLGFWIQAASAYLFGFHGWSLLLPQALAGVLCVALLYHLVGRSFGPVASLLAALALALSPISVATNRHNNLESLLVLAVLLAAWAFILAVETGRLRWLVVGGIVIGLGFNIKMCRNPIADRWSSGKAQRSSSRSTGWRSVARGASGVAEDLALHGDKTPLVALRAEG
jgi:Dolichyl-phosphate-mannose-protein mannosyltransferase